MAIKIINDTPHKSVVKETICRSCGVTLEYLPADVKQKMESDYLGDVDVLRYIQCPKCQHEQIVERF